MMRLLATDQSSDVRLSDQRLMDAQARHQQLDTRLKQLGRTAYPTPTEQLEMTEIKKRKLLAKDEIARLKAAY